MREILFRGQTRKRVEKVLAGSGEKLPGIWAYGGIFPQNKGGSYSIIYTYDPIDKKTVYADTVGQYTGLTDKNDVKIFEGDICDFTVFDYLDNDTQYRGVVIYAGSRFMLWKSEDNEYYGADGGFDLDWVVAQDDEFEIIGNIHDNPELLEEKS